MTETAIQQIRKFETCQLTQPEGLRRVLPLPGVMQGLGSCFPSGDDRERALAAEALIREAVVHIANSQARDKLCRCTGESVLQALMDTARLGLTLSRALGEAYLVPFKYACTHMTGYRGFIKLMANTGIITHVESVLVYTGESFKWWRDEHGPHWEHQPILSVQGKKELIEGSYAVGYVRHATSPVFEICNIDQLRKIRKASKAADSPAYRLWAPEMYRKAPVRRMGKWIPKTGEPLATQILAKAIEMDNRDFGLLAAEAEQTKRERAKQLHDSAHSGRKALPEPEQEPPPEYTPDGDLIPDHLGREGEDDAEA